MRYINWCFTFLLTSTPHAWLTMFSVGCDKSSLHNIYSVSTKEWSQLLLCSIAETKNNWKQYTSLRCCCQGGNKCKSKARYALATNLNSTRSTLLKVNKVDRVALAPYTLATMSTVSATKLNVSTLLPICWRFRQLQSTCFLFYCLHLRFNIIFYTICVFI